MLIYPKGQMLQSTAMQRSAGLSHEPHTNVTMLSVLISNQRLRPTGAQCVEFNASAHCHPVCSCRNNPSTIEPGLQESSQLDQESCDGI